MFGPEYSANSYSNLTSPEFQLNGVPIQIKFSMRVKQELNYDGTAIYYRYNGTGAFSQVLNDSTTGVYFTEMPFATYKGYGGHGTSTTSCMSYAFSNQDTGLLNISLSSAQKTGTVEIMFRNYGDTNTICSSAPCGVWIDDFNVTELSDTEAPQYSLNSTNSTLAGEKILHSLYWTDNYELDSYTFSFCNGTWNGTFCEDVGSSDWDNSTYDNRKQINITNIAGETLTDFPVYINLTYDDDMLSDYSDIIFYMDGDLLGFEVENYTSAKANVWVNIPSFETGTSSIYVYYNNNTPVVSKSNGAEAFIDYLSVHHLNSVNSTDSLGLINGTVSDPAKLVSTTGVVGKSIDVTPYAYINLGSNRFDVANITVCAWLKIDTLFATDQRAVTTGLENTNKWQLGVSGSTFIMAGVTASHATKISNSAVTTGVWYYLCGVNSPETLYVNGVLQTSTKTDSWSFENNAKIGSRGGAHGIDGMIDDVTIYDGVLSYGRINQSYQQVNTLSLTTSVGSEELFVPVTGWVNDSSVEFTTGWSNVTKMVDDTVGNTVAWCVYANDTSNNKNNTCDSPYTYELTEQLESPVLNCSYGGSIIKISYRVNTFEDFPMTINVSGQTSNVPLLNCTNTGASGTFKMSRSDTYSDAGGAVYDICGITNNPNINLTTSLLTIGTIGTDEYVGVWCMRNYTGLPDTKKTLSYSLILE